MAVAITAETIRQAAVVAAAMMVAIPLLDWIGELPRGSLLRFSLTFSTLGLYYLGVQALLR